MDQDTIRGENEITTENDLLDALSGEGWVTAELVVTGDSEPDGVRVDGIEVTSESWSLVSEDSEWSRWRGEVAGFEVEWVDCSDCDVPRDSDAAIFVFGDSEGRVSPHFAWREATQRVAV